MSSYDRRAAARRRAWGRGPMILRFEPLEGRQLLSGGKPDLFATQFSTVSTATWGGQIAVTGTISNRGGTATRVPVEVDIWASSKPKLTTANAVTELLGSVFVPAGLAAKATYTFNQLVTLPPTSTTVTSTTVTQPLYVTLNVDPNNAANESAMSDKNGRGIGLDTAQVLVSQQMPANLVGTAFSISPVSMSTPGVYSWGDTFDVTEQIKNNGLGNAPPTRARIVLTPAGATPGGYSDVTIGDISVPAIPAFGTTNVVQQVTLPPLEPLTLGGATQFTVSVVQDADFLTQPVYPQVATQGIDIDQGPLGINPGPLAATPQGPTPDLAPSTVLVSQNSLVWGQQFQVSAAIQNVSNVASPPFTVRFVAAGATGDVSHGIFLGDVQVPALAANSVTNVLTTVKLPSILPFGDTVASPSYSQIYAITDPEDMVNESLRSNNMSASAPVLLQVVGSGGATTTVPTYPQNVYTSATLAATAAKQAALNQQVNLGTPKPAAVVKKHKVDALASVSESVENWFVKQVKAIPEGTKDLLKSLGVSSGSNSSNAATPANSTVATTTAAAANPNAAGNTGGTGGFGATPLGSNSVA
jgi:CARDB